MQIIESIGKLSALCLCSCGNKYKVKSKYDAKKSPIGHLCTVCKNRFICMGEITQEKLLKAFHYVPDTGELTYRFDSKNGFAGEVATINHSAGYLSVRINGKDYLAHRIIFFMLVGRFPEQIDHINHNKKDNCWVNLREVNNQENCKNTSLQTNSKTGLIGVCLHKPTGKYRAYIMVNRKHIHLGLFDTIEAAAKERQKANLYYNFHENHGKMGCNNDTV